ncbi:MAG: hypothetical protein ACRD0L_15635 [Acidimicrobiales bacterium]
MSIAIAALSLAGASGVGWGAGAAAAQPSTTSGPATSGCQMALRPTSGPVGTLVSITGSTATCKDGGYGGAFGFDDEGAGVLIADLPAHGSFTYSFRIPTSMPAGDWFAAAQGYEGGSPVAPGPASFHTTMGAPLSATFTVSGAPPGWADFTSIIATGAQCSSCINAGFGATPYGGPGYELLRSDGYVRTFGSVPNAAGNAGDLHLAAPIVAAAFTPGGGGYWMLGADGGIFTYGDAGFHGSATSAHPRPPWVGIAPTPDGHGYWVAEADGSVVCFGDARSHGQLGSPPAGIGVGPAAPIVGMAATPDGGGYWLVGRDGGVFSFGDAGFHGSALGVSPGFPMVGIASTPDGKGYWLLAADGGVFTYGDAPFFGSGRS